jgi:hypothetical protein
MPMRIWILIVSGDEALSSVKVLDRHGALNCVQSAVELDQERVADP